MDYSTILNAIYLESKALPVIGTIATTIPELASVNPDKFGIYLTTIDNQKNLVLAIATKNFLFNRFQKRCRLLWLFLFWMKKFGNE